MTTQTDLMDLYLVALVLLASFAVSTTFFTVAYIFRSRGRWTQTSVGRILVWLGTILAFMLWLTLWGQFHPHFPRVMLGASIVGYGIGTMLMWELTIQMWIASKSTYRRRRTVESYTKPQPILKWMSILVGVDTIAGGAALSNFLAPDMIGLILLILAGSKVGLAFYLRGQVVPFADVGAYRNEHAEMVAGPASPVRNETPVAVRAED